MGAGVAQQQGRGETLGGCRVGAGGGGGPPQYRCANPNPQRSRPPPTTARVGPAASAAPGRLQRAAACSGAGCRCVVLTPR